MFSNAGAFGGVELFKLEELNEFAKEFLEKRLQNVIKQIGSTLKCDAEKIRKDYLNACDKLFLQCIRQQEKGEKDAIRFVYFFFLKSALLTGKHEIQINAYTKDGYMDKVETMELWHPSFITDIFEQDMKELDLAAKKKIMHYSYSQYMELREKCFPIYVSFIGKYIISEIAKVTELASYQKMNKEEEFEMIYGGYMDKGIRVWPPMQIVCDKN